MYCQYHRRYRNFLGCRKPGYLQLDNHPKRVKQHGLYYPDRLFSYLSVFIISVTETAGIAGCFLPARNERLFPCQFTRASLPTRRACSANVCLANTNRIFRTAFHLMLDARQCTSHALGYSWPIVNPACRSYFALSDRCHFPFCETALHPVQDRSRFPDLRVF